MPIRKYGRLLYSINDSEGRKINLYLYSYNHIQKVHDRIELWVKHWKRVIERIKPREESDTLFYEDRVENGETIQIRVAKEEGEYLIKTAIFCKGVIKKWKRK